MPIAYFVLRIRKLISISKLEYEIRNTQYGIR